MMSGETAPEDDWDFFVSYTQADQAWAEWIAWVLEEVGFRVLLQAWDFAPGSNWVACMNKGVSRARRTIAVLSENYLQSVYGAAEWQAAWVADPDGHDRKLLVVRVVECERPGLLNQANSLDMFARSEAQARAELLRAAHMATTGERAKPGSPPPFPFNRRTVPQRPSFPHGWPTVWNVPPRLSHFIGRRGVLNALKRILSGPVAVAAVSGMGGVGKSALVAEFAHAYAGNYDVAWWIDAEDPNLISEQLASLAKALAIVDSTVNVPLGSSQAAAWLRSNQRWLIILDNAESPGRIRDWIPQGQGHVLITSRSQHGGQVARQLYVDVFMREESVSLLRTQSPTLSTEVASSIAHSLGDLPLALTQAAGLLAETGMTADEYLRELEARTSDLLAEGIPADYPTSLVGAVTISLERLQEEGNAGIQLINLLAFFAPERAPLSLLQHASVETLPDPLGAMAKSPLKIRRVVGRLAQYGLIKIVEGGDIQVHRLVQHIVVDSLAPDQHAKTLQCLHQLLCDSDPGDPDDPATWNSWTALAPHIQACFEQSHLSDYRPAAHSAFRKLILRFSRYLYASCQYPALQNLCGAVIRQWAQALGEDHLDTLMAKNRLASALTEVGQHGEAHTLFMEVLDQYRAVFGDEDGLTLVVSNNLGVALNGLKRYDEARELLSDTLERSKLLLGPDHQTSLRVGDVYGTTLIRLGEYNLARVVLSETLEGRTRTIGEHHPYTLWTASQLGEAMLGLGESVGASELLRKTLSSQQDVLDQASTGTYDEEHPDIVYTKYVLGKIL